MTQLRELQRAFQSRILSFERGIEAELTGAHRADFESRLGAYVGGYRARLVEALGTTYPVLKATLGEEEFERQMRLYIDSTPSRYVSVRHYGAEIAGRMRSADLAGGDGEALSELAQWEWTLADVFDAPDDGALRVEAMAAVPPDAWPAATFQLRACVRRLRTHTNAVEWWRAANGLSDQPASLAKAHPAEWLLWRRGVKTLFRSLDPLEAEALDAISTGTAFGSLCELLARQRPELEVASYAASHLRGWIAEELISACSCGSALG